jgi:hypothetical protein
MLTQEEKNKKLKSLEKELEKRQSAINNKRIASLSVEKEEAELSEFKFKVMALAILIKKDMYEDGMEIN